MGFVFDLFKYKITKSIWLENSIYQLFLNLSQYEKQKR